MDRNTLATASRRYLLQTNTGFIGTTMMRQGLDDAAIKLNRDTEYNRTDATISIKTGAREITLPTSAGEIYAVRLGTGTDRKALTPTTRAALDREDDDWEAGTAGTPTEYYADGKYIGFHPKPLTRAAWTKSTAYAVGDIIIPSGPDNGFTYKCTVAGTSAVAASQPTWPTTLDGTVGDAGDLAWQQDGHTRVYLRTLSDPPVLTNGTTVPTWLPTRYHKTIAKGNALDLAATYMADGDVSSVRLQRLYEEYARDVSELRRLADRRSANYVGRAVVKGYSTFRRL